MALSEAFGFEERWLRLVVKAVPSDAALLSADSLRSQEGMADAQYRLGGIGNRQVLALRDWAKATGIVEFAVDGRCYLSPFGAILLRLDPGLEEVSTFWAIHHRLCISEEIWFYAHYANAMKSGQFTRAQLKRCLREGKKTSDSVLEKKALFPLLQTMKGTKLGTDLGLLVPLGDGAYQRRMPDERRLESTVLAYMIVDWCVRRHRTTVHLSELTAWGAPGSYLALDAEHLADMLRRIQEKHSSRILSISRTAGLNSVALGDDLRAESVLACGYLERLEKLDPAVALRKAADLTEETAGGNDGRLLN